MHHANLTQSYALCLPIHLSAKPIDHAKHVAIVGRNLAKLEALAAGSRSSTPKHRLRYKRATTTIVKRGGTWTVRAGDTGNGIAARLGISFVQLAFLNPMVQWHNLQIGQILNIPCADGTTGSRPYAIIAGDTGNAIAAANGITFDLLSAYNPGVVWTNLQIGQMLIIPNPTMGKPEAVDMQGGEVIQNDGSIAAGGPSGTTPQFDDGMYHSTSSQTQIGSSAAETTNTLAGAPKVVQENSPFLTPGKSKKSPEQQAQSEPQTVEVRLVRKNRDDQSNLNSNALTSPTAIATSVSTYTVKAGDTGYAIAIAQGISFLDLAVANPGVIWTNLQIGQSLMLPKSIRASVVPAIPKPIRPSPAPVRKAGQDIYTLYSGPASTPPYPLMSAWLNFSTLWTLNLPHIGTTCDFSSGSVPPNTQPETAALQTSIAAVANETGVNPAFILAMVLQESNGCVRVPTTSSWQGIRNPGLLQSFNGAATCNNGTRTMQPCPDTMIKAMISEGVKGVRNVGILPALQQAAKLNGVVWPMERSSSTSRRKRDELPCPEEPTVAVPVHKKFDEALLYYQAARIYNSGSMPADGDLSGATGSTRCYVSDIVNRLMGWVMTPRMCWL